MIPSVSTSVTSFVVSSLDHLSCFRYSADHSVHVRNPNMDQYLYLPDTEITLPSGTVYEENPLMNPLFQNQLAEPGIGGNTYDLGTGSHVLNDYRLADHHRHQQQSLIRDQRTVNVNITSMKHQAVLEQPAGSSQPSKQNNVDPKKLAKQRSDLKYREKKKEEMKDLKRKADMLKERNEHLENENASLKKDGAWMEKALKQSKRDVYQLKDKHDGLSTTLTEISKALAESKYIEIQRENELLKCNMNLLMKQMKNPNSLNEIQLQARIAQLEREKSTLQLVIDALCAKMKRDPDDEPEYER